MPARATTTIPALPCISMEESLEFWRSLDFKVTYTQKAPSPYAVIEAKDYALHLFGLRQLKAEDNFTTCLIVVPEVERLHETMTTQLRAFLGRMPAKGFPRLSRMKPHQTRFTLTDPSGNSLIFVKRGVDDEKVANAYKEEGLTPLQRATAMAVRLQDFKHDDEAAAKVLDVALARAGAEAPKDVARALIARVDLAMQLDEKTLVPALREKFSALTLSASERKEMQLEMTRVLAASSEG